MATRTLRIAFLHLAPRPGDLAYNRQLVDTAVTTAAGLGAAWILTPELCICGYAFADQIGTDWIVSPPDPWMREFCQQIARMRVGRRCSCRPPPGLQASMDRMANGRGVPATRDSRSWSVIERDPTARSTLRQAKA
jgi:hypothetical protein